MSAKKVGILGSGEVAQALGKGFASVGYEVMLGSRTPEKLRSWLGQVGGKTQAGTFGEAASFGDLNVLATLGEATENVIDLAGPGRFSDKLVIDATNPLDFSKGMTPDIHSKYGVTSLGQTVQQKLPESRVVKCFNTVPNSLFFRPRFDGSEMLICGNDRDAKQEVTKILKEFGWTGSIDIGGIENARWLEALCALWVRTASATGAWSSMFKLIR